MSVVRERPLAANAPATPSPSPESGSAPTLRAPRLAALDAARALGVVAMVMGHTLHAVLSEAAWQSPVLAAYNHARGFTAPLFLLVSGWAVTLAISRSGATGWDVPRGRVRRALLLLAVGYGLRWPGWGLGKLVAGDRKVWAHFLGFDALHCIAVALLATSLVLALPWNRYAKAAILAALAAGAVLAGAGAGTPGETAANLARLPEWLPAMALAQVVGGTSHFPLFPWSGYFFAGTLLGLLAPPDRRGAAGIALVAVAALLATTQWAGLGGRTAGHPVLVVYRIGVVLAVLSALFLVPPRLAARAAPLGKSSLGVYAIHLLIVYGWYLLPFWFPWYPLRGLASSVGKTLGPAAGLAVAVLVLAVSYAVYRLAGAAWRRARSAKLRMRAEDVEGVRGRVGGERG